MTLSVQAGLKLAAAVNALKASVSLQTRIGIATGLVVVGDLIGSGEAQERGIVGETPNVAARLQAIAEPNTVVIAEGTRRLLGNLFELAKLATRELKGITGPVQIWTVLRASSVASRFEALRGADRTGIPHTHPTYVTEHRIRPVETRERIVIGTPVPRDVELETVSEEWGPFAHHYRHIYPGDQKLVDPETRTVVQEVE